MFFVRMDWQPGGGQSDASAHELVSIFVCVEVPSKARVQLSQLPCAVRSSLMASFRDYSQELPWPFTHRNMDNSSLYLHACSADVFFVSPFVFFFLVPRCAPAGRPV